jgi:hypothetical protein
LYTRELFSLESKLNEPSASKHYLCCVDKLVGNLIFFISPSSLFRDCFERQLVSMLINKHRQNIITKK